MLVRAWKVQNTNGPTVYMWTHTRTKVGAGSCEATLLSICYSEKVMFLQDHIQDKLKNWLDLCCIMKADEDAYVDDLIKASRSINFSSM